MWFSLAVITPRLDWSIWAYLSVSISRVAAVTPVMDSATSVSSCFQRLPPGRRVGAVVRRLLCPHPLHQEPLLMSRQHVPRSQCVRYVVSGSTRWDTNVPSSRRLSDSLWMQHESQWAGGSRAVGPVPMESNRAVSIPCFANHFFPIDQSPAFSYIFICVKNFGWKLPFSSDTCRHASEQADGNMSTVPK